MQMCLFSAGNFTFYQLQSCETISHDPNQYHFFWSKRISKSIIFASLTLNVLRVEIQPVFWGGRDEFSNKYWEGIQVP